MDLSKLSEPFSAEDIEWRVSRAGHGYCYVLAYITARAIQKRLDDVCGPDNWRNEEPRILEINGKATAFAGGISIRCNGEWVTKWDVAEPTQIEPAKGGFSGAMKRAGAQWGVGRYLYHLDETRADVSDQEQKPKGSGWNYAKLKDGGKYWWRTPELPAWALPKEREHEIKESELVALKKSWRDKFAADVKSPAELLAGFSRFVTSIVGEFPLGDFSCWTRESLERCQKKISEQRPGEISNEVPFES